MKRKATYYNLNDVLSKVVAEDRESLKYRLKQTHPDTWREEYDKLVKVVFDGVRVKMDSARYQTFRQRGTKCVRCGMEGLYFALEAHDVDADRGVYHFNLYGRKDAQEVLITKDHIIPKSKGGKDILSNFQPMCSICNCSKGDII